jgi:hypothetical protein
MKKKYILLFLIALTYNLAFSQKFFTYKTPGYLGKKFYITGGGGISPFNISKEFANSLSYYGGVNYTLGMKTDIGAKVVMGTLKDEELSGNSLAIQARILTSNHIAPIGTRWGLGLHYATYSLNFITGGTAAVNTAGASLVIERNFPISNRFLLTYGTEFGFSLALDKSNVLRHDENAYFARFNLGLCYMVF